MQSRRAVARRRQPRARRRRDSSTRSWRLASTAPSHPSTTSQSPRAASLSKHAVADAKESPSFRRSSTQIRPSTFRGDSLKRIVTRSAGGRPSRAGRLSVYINVRGPQSPTVLAASTAPCASRLRDLLFTRRRRQRHLAPCPPSDARTVHEASVTAAARLPGVTGGRIDEASCARRRRGHHVECPRTPQTSLGPGKNCGAAIGRSSVSTIAAAAARCQRTGVRVPRAATRGGGGRSTDQMRGSCGAARGLPRPCKMWRRLCCENASKRLAARGLGCVALAAVPLTQLRRARSKCGAEARLWFTLGLVAALEAHCRPARPYNASMR